MTSNTAAESMTSGRAQAPRTASTSLGIMNKLATKNGGAA